MNTDFNGNNGEYNIFIACGGSFQKTIEEAGKIFGKSMAIYVDTEKEVNKCKAKDVIKVSLVEHANTEELCGNFKANDRYREAVKRINAGPGMDIAKGAGQYPLMGEMQFQYTLNNTNLKNYLEKEITDRLYMETRGEVNKVNIKVLSGTGGGVGSGTTIAIVNLVESIVYKSTGTRAEVSLVRIGGLSHLGCGSRVIMNTTHILPEMKAWVNNRDGKVRDPGETRNVFLLETPMVQKDRETRDKLHRVTASSMFSPKVSEEFSGCSINNNDFSDFVSNPFPGVYTVRPCYWGNLEITDIKAAVAVHLINMIEQAENRDDESSSGSPVEIYVELEETDTSITDSSLLANSSGDKNTDELAELAKATGKSYSAGNVFVKVSNDSKMHLRSIVSGNKKTNPKNLGEYHERMHFLNDIRANMEEQFEKASDESSRKEIKLKKTGKKLDKCIRDMSQESFAVTRFFDSVSSFFSKSHNKKKKKTFRGNIEKYRTVKAEQERLTALKNTLRMSISFIEVEINRLREKMNNLTRMLGKVRNSGSIIDRNLVQLNEDNRFIGRLLEASSLGQEALNEEIERTRAIITEYGIRRILNLPADATNQQVAWKLVREQPDIIAPYWGGKRPKNRPLFNFLVLPPVQKKLQNALQQEIKKLDSDWIVANRTSISAGMEIVKMEYHIATTQEAVITPLYQLQQKHIKDNPFYPPYIPKNGGVAHV
ncbi:MAG: hypothetical protein K8T10_15745 [Candidatus Eremiobacteraeota bacterium]|nr:hypothetical protein [Candidatus Eremiobacteraeota bacterium]